MSVARPKIHAWCHPYGDTHDPWPGDLATSDGLMSVYRFDGQHWRLVR